MELKLPSTATADFYDLLRHYREMPVQYPQLKSVTFAQWALESGWGTSGLARDHKNYGGMKWRAYMNGWAVPVSYKAWDGETLYCKFPDHDFWIWGYFGRFSKEPAYKGWKDHLGSGSDFIQFVGPIWLGMKPADNAKYVRDVLRIEKMIAPNFEGQNNEKAPDSARADPHLPWGRVRPDADFGTDGP